MRWFSERVYCGLLPGTYFIDLVGTPRSDFGDGYPVERAADAIGVNVLTTPVWLARRYQTIERVVNGTFSMQQEWMLSQGMQWWDEQEAG